MKKTIITTLILAIALVSISTAAFARDMVLDKKMGKIEYRTDKNGNEYARTFVQEMKSLNGISYSVGVAVMFFGEAVESLKTSNLSEGDDLKAIVSSSDYNGRTSYSVLALIQ